MIDSKIFSGQRDIVLFSANENGNTVSPLETVIADSFSWEFNGVPDDSVVPSGSCCFETEINTIENEAFFKSLFGENAMGREHQVVIQFKVYIHRPKNLKYPNKKRARRIWKKWAKRYGTSGGESVVIPKATIEIDEQGGHITAQSITED